MLEASDKWVGFAARPFHVIYAIEFGRSLELACGPIVIASADNRGFYSAPFNHFVGSFWMKTNAWE
jgi:hypothetical protein